MPQAKFTKDFDYRVHAESAASSIVAYKKGWSGSIPQAHIDAATAADALEKPTSTAVKPAAKEGADAGGRATS